MLRRIMIWFEYSIANKMLAASVSGLFIASFVNIVLLFGPLRFQISGFLKNNNEAIKEVKDFQESLGKVRASLEASIAGVADANAELLLSDVKRSLQTHLGIFTKQSEDALDQMSGYLLEENAKNLVAQTDIARIIIKGSSGETEVRKNTSGEISVSSASEIFQEVVADNPGFVGIRQVTRGGVSYLEAVSKLTEHGTTLVLHQDVSKTISAITAQKQKLIGEMNTRFQEGTAPFFERLDKLSQTATSNGSQLGRNLNGIILFIGLLNTVLIVGGVYYSLHLASQIVKPLHDLEAAAKRMAGGDFNVTLTSTSKDEVAQLAHHFQKMAFSLKESYETLEFKVKDRTQAVRTILDHVHFGLMRCDKNMKVLEGYSSSCAELFRTDTSLFLGEKLTTLLCLSERDQGNFECMYEQVFEDVGPEELTLSQIPGRLRVRGRTVSLQGSVVRGEGGEVESILFCVADITELEKAELEIAESRTLLKIIRSRDRFQTLVCELSHTLPELKQYLATEQSDTKVRCVLHTWKGVFGVYGLNEFSALIHTIESNEVITDEHMSELEETIRTFLHKHSVTLEIDFDTREEEIFAVSLQTLHHLEESVKQQNESAVLRKTVLEFISRSKRRPASDLLGPVGETTRLLAVKLGKKVRFELVGGQILLPQAMEPMINTLTHLVRNSVDHGIERPQERTGKPAEGRIALEFLDESEFFVIRFCDDGRGIDPKKVADKAQKQGLLTEAQLKDMSDQQKTDLIFHPGFSTAEVVSDISGRGIGMSAIEAAVNALGGSVAVSSKITLGTEILIRIPKANIDGGRSVDSDLHRAA